METAKKPEVLLGAGNTVAIVGLSIYFYKQLAAIKAEMDELSEHLKTSVNTFMNLKNSTFTREQFAETANALNTKIEETNKSISKIGNDDGMEMIEQALEDLSDELSGMGLEMKWSYPPRRHKRRRGGKDKRRKKSKRSYSSDLSEDLDDDDEDSDSEIERSVAQVRKKKRSKRS